MTKAEAAVIVATVAGIDITRHEMSVVQHAGKLGGTTEVITMEHPVIKSLITKGIFRACKLRAGPLALPIAEPGIKLTQFGEKVYAETKPQEAVA